MVFKVFQKIFTTLYNWVRIRIEVKSWIRIIIKIKSWIRIQIKVMRIFARNSHEICFAYSRKWEEHFLFNHNHNLRPL